MTKSSSRKIVVLRDIPSNMIEEAILVLKNDNHESQKNSSLEKSKIEKKRDFLVLKEAEMIIDNYINSKNTVDTIKKTTPIVKKWYVDFMINAGLVFGIGIFLFLLLKII